MMSEIPLGFDPSSPLRLWSALEADVEAHQGASLASVSTSRRLWTWARVLVRSPGFRMTLIHRLAYESRKSLGIPGSAVAALLFWVVRYYYCCSIATTAELHGGLIFPHPQGIVIGPGTRLGPRAWIFQNVTIGGTQGREGLPTIGADARLYAGAVLAGPIRVGEAVVVGANAVVLSDVPAFSLVRSPAPEIRPSPDRPHVEPMFDTGD